MPRGGKRQGTPGKAYSNRTDLMTNYDPAKNTAAAGGLTSSAPSTPATGPALPQLGQANPPRIAGPVVGADEIPNLTDPTQRPDEPVTAGIDMGPGPGSNALGPMPPSPSDPTRMIVQALMDISPSPDLARILNRLDFEGR